MEVRSSPGGWALLESVVALGVLAAASLGLAEALGHALAASERAALRLREDAIRRTLAGDPVAPATTSWIAVDPAVGGQACWKRLTSLGDRWVRIEVLCGTERSQLPEDTLDTALLVRR